MEPKTHPNCRCVIGSIPHGEILERRRRERRNNDLLAEVYGCRPDLVPDVVRVKLEDIDA